MAGKKKEIQLQAIITNQTQWDEMLLTKGVTVIDVYQAWCGPCKAVVNLFRKLKNEQGEDGLLHFAVDCKIIAMVRGANAPLLSKTVIELLEEERKILAGEIERPEVQELVFLEEKASEITTEESQLDEGVIYTVAIIKPDAVANGRLEDIKQKITEAGFHIAAEEEKTLTEDQVRDFYSRNIEQPDFEDFVTFMTGGPSHILVISKPKEVTGAVPQWKELDKSDESISAAPQPEKPVSLQEVLESENMLNLCDVEDSIEEASRQLAFFFPDFGKKRTGQNVEKTLALIRPSLLKKRRNSILKRIKDDGFTIAMQREIVLTEEQARQFYKEHENEDFFPTLLEHMTSGPTLALALIRENAVQHWRDLLGPKTLEEAKEKSPNSLRSEYAVDNVPLNQLHGSISPGEAEKELEFFFPVEHTLAVIKPTAVMEHKDDIMRKVANAGFIVSQMKETNFTHEMATQFYKDHEGKPFFDQLVNYMSEGPSMVMILTKENAVEEWRQLMGPADPDIAKESSPDSIRAQFAEDILRNAVHGSSNKEHALKSIEYVFGEIDLNSLRKGRSI
ncbi:thioredoxin domain-containing protein 3 isoform X2 [Pelodiscus sinensis]|uniref:thioredoxin domain-containing protein 3 isoform X2 n=1 Tax=Pelodiscus sinensis TaxID=13735 RepID=UPI000D723BFE|nr:thioredoxin domain-containing protein 3 isoform X2 [Pelodiscus sinensis]|eukprot:XP_025040953.1 thioredoxin domain-containing protein 3 isoform X2 [Pelodiscus sinensis]